MSVKVTVTGVEQMIRALDKLKDEKTKKILPALRSAAGVVYRKSQGYVPVDKGPLKASGRIEDNGKQGNGAQVRVLYGGDSAPYALYVHEDLEAHHAPPTCAKFLERAYRETRGTQTSIVMRELKSETVYTKNGREVD